jgi:hypothetical protein
MKACVCVIKHMVVCRMAAFKRGFECTHVCRVQWMKCMNLSLGDDLAILVREYRVLKIIDSGTQRMLVY